MRMCVRVWCVCGSVVPCMSGVCCVLCECNPNFNLDFLVLDELDERNLIPMYKTHPEFWCLLLGQKGESNTQVDMVVCVCVCVCACVCVWARV